MNNFGLWFKSTVGKQFIGGVLNKRSFSYGDIYYWPNKNECVVDRTVWSKLAEGVLLSW